MQTFLPYPSAEQSAKVLDTQRLGKQRVECLQILATLCDIYKIDANPKKLGIEPGTISLEPHCFCTHDGTVWAWNPNRRGGWANHPAVKMWSRYEAALVEYSLAVCAEWVYRGYRDSTALTISLLADLSLQVMHAGLTDNGMDPDAYLTPVWWGSTSFHTSHQSNLLRKDEEHYGKFFPEAPRDLPYIWPDAGAKRTSTRRGSSTPDLRRKRGRWSLDDPGSE